MIDYGRPTLRQVVMFYAAKGRGYRTATRRYGLCRTVARVIARRVADYRERQAMKRAGVTECDTDTLLSGEPIRPDACRRSN